jgi:hypothetical protein
MADFDSAPPGLRLVDSSDDEARFSPAGELRARWEKYLRRHIRMSPWIVTRASGIGDLCERRIFYHRTEGHREEPHSIELQAIFDLGKHLEPYVIQKIEAMGFEVVQRGKDWFDPDIEVSGHVDALIVHEAWPFEIVTEIKGLNEFTTSTISVIDDIKFHDQTWVRKYYDQIQLYLWMENRPLGIFVLLGKTSGDLIFIDCPRDEERIYSLLDKARRIRDAVRTKTAPARTIFGNECGRCGFRHICCPDRVYGETPLIIEPPPRELIEMLERRHVLTDSHKEFQKLDRRVKNMLPEAPHVIVGGFAVEGKRSSEGCLTRTITRLGEKK